MEKAIIKLGDIQIQKTEVLSTYRIYFKKKCRH